MAGNNIIPLNVNKRKTQKISYTETMEGDQKVSKDNYLTREELENLEEKIDLKMKVATQPLESKIDNLPNIFKILILEEREYQNEKSKETNRYVWGTLALGAISIVVSIIGFLL